MKKFTIKSFILTAFIIIISFNSCDISRLDSPPLGLTEDTYFTLQSEFEQSIFNAYAKMTDWYWFRAQNFLQPMYFLQGDDITENNGVFSTWEII